MLDLYGVMKVLVEEEEIEISTEGVVEVGEIVVLIGLGRTKHSTKKPIEEEIAESKERVAEQSTDSSAIISISLAFSSSIGSSVENSVLYSTIVMFCSSTLSLCASL